MKSYTAMTLKFVKAFLLFAILKIALSWWRSGFGCLVDIVHNYSNILTEAFCFAIVWMLVTKIRKREAVSERE